MNYFNPIDSLSTQLCFSIPNKVKAILAQMKLDKIEEGKIGKLAWFFSESDISSLSYAQPGDEDYVAISWDKDSISGTDERFQNLSTELEFLISVEKRIYTILEDFQKLANAR